MQGFSVRLDDLAAFTNGVVDFAANYELIVGQLTEADLRESQDKLRKVLGSPGHSGKAGEFFASCEAFVNNYAELMHLLLRVNTAIRNEFTRTTNNLAATHDTYAELERRHAGTFHDLLIALTSKETSADGSA
jgi:hypothetical protein